MFKKKLNILLIGRGYIGTYLKKDINKNFNIHLLSKKKFLLKKKIKNIDILIHSVGFNKPESFKNKIKAINLKKKFTNKIIKFCKLNYIPKIIYLSSALVYSENLYGKVSEKNSCKNKHPYALSHLFAENILKKNSSDCLKIIIFRLSNVFGVNDNTNNKQFIYVINNFVRDAVLNKKININNKFLMRDFLPMNYFIKILGNLPSFDDNFKIINVGFKTYRLIKMAQIVSSRVKRLLGYSPQIVTKNNKRNNRKRLNYVSLFLKKNANSSFLIKEIDNSIKSIKKFGLYK
jgi:nucleoside-diphosphate-sugar epimerase